MEEVKAKSRTRRSRADMYELMLAYSQSGQTQASFCEIHGLKVGTFQYWWRLYRSEEETAAIGGFVALEPESGSVSSVELKYGGVNVLLREVSSTYVAEVVHQLSRLC